MSPYRLAASHARFGKIKMAVGLFDRNGEPVETVVSEPITADNATFTFDLPEATVRSSYDAVIWFREG